MTTAYCELIISERVHTGEEFILACAKAFIPCYPLHSEPLDTPLPEVIKADTASLQDGLDKANTELHELEEMSLEQAQQKLDEEIFLLHQLRDARREETKRANALYNKILKDIADWHPPTKEYGQLRSFAIDQIRQCYGDLPGDDTTLPEAQMTAQMWLDQKVNSCKEKIEYYSKEIDRLNRIAEYRTQWLKGLRSTFVGSHTARRMEGKQHATS